MSIGSCVQKMVCRVEMGEQVWVQKIKVCTDYLNGVPIGMVMRVSYMLSTEIRKIKITNVCCFCLRTGDHQYFLKKKVMEINPDLTMTLPSLLLGRLFQ